MASKAEGVRVGAAYVDVRAATDGLVDDIGDALGTTSDQANDAGQKIGEQLEEGSKQKTKGLGSRLMAWGGFAAIGVAVGSLFKSGWDNALTQADMERTMAANLGITPQLAAGYADVAADLYAQGWGASLEEVGGSVQSMLSELGDLSKDELEELAPLLMGIAEQTGADMARLSDATSKLVITGLADNAVAAADIVAKAYQSFGESSGEDILDTITEYSGQFEKLGIDAETAMGMVKQAMDAGARNTDFVADALKEFSIRSVDGSKASMEAYDALGLSGEEMTKRLAAGGPGAAAAMQEVFDAINGVGDAATKEQLAVALFGTKAEDLGAALEAMNPRTAAEGFGEFAGTAQDMADASMSLDDMLNGLGRTLSLSIADTIRPMLPMLRDFMGVVTGVFGWLRDNPIVTTILLAIGAAIAVMAAAQWAFNVAMLANPIVLWVTLALVAIGALVAGIAWVWQNWGGIVAFFGETTTNVGGWFAGLWAGVTAGATNAWNAIIAGIQAAIQWVIDRITDAQNAFTDLFGGATGKSNSKAKSPKAPKVPGLKDGGTVTQSGWTKVGEEGEELLHLGKGSSVIPLPYVDDLAKATGNGSGNGQTVNIINPVAEKSSQSLSRYRRDIGADIALA